MKSVFRFHTAFLAVFFLLCFFSSGAFAGEAPLAPAPTTESITLKKGETLWKIAMAQNLPRRDWPKYWKDTCARSHIPCTELAWRKLPAGSVIVVPRDPRVVLAESALRLELEQTLSELKTLSAELALMRERLARLEADLQATYRGLGIAAFALLVFCFAAIMTYMTHRRHHLKDKETTHLGEVSEEGSKPALSIAPCCALPPHTPSSDIKQRNLDGWHPM